MSLVVIRSIRNGGTGAAIDQNYLWKVHARPVPVIDRLIYFGKNIYMQEAEIGPASVKCLEYLAAPLHSYWAFSGRSFAAAAKTPSAHTSTILFHSIGSGHPVRKSHQRCLGGAISSSLRMPCLMMNVGQPRKQLQSCSVQRERFGLC